MPSIPLAQPMIIHPCINMHTNFAHTHELKAEVPKPKLGNH